MHGANNISDHDSIVTAFDGPVVHPHASLVALVLGTHGMGQQTLSTPCSFLHNYSLLNLLRYLSRCLCTFVGTTPNTVLRWAVAFYLAHNTSLMPLPHPTFERLQLILRRSHRLLTLPLWLLALLL
jgi:hypothetical protein